LPSITLFWNIFLSLSYRLSMLLQRLSQNFNPSGFTNIYVGSCANLRFSNLQSRTFASIDQILALPQASKKRKTKSASSITTTTTKAAKAAKSVKPKTTKKKKKNLSKNFQMQN